MQELIQLVSEKTGLSQEHAKLAVDTVLGFVRAKLPAPLAAQVDSLLAGSSAASALGGIGDLAKGLGGMFGK